MKKLLSILFAAMIGLSLSMATFAQDAPKAETTKSESKKKTHHKSKTAKASKKLKSETPAPAETK